MNSLVCENITKNFGSKEALKGVSFELKQHKIYGLIGRNGAGKTTLLGIISGQNRLSGGKVSYNGENIWENQKALNEICFSREMSTTILFGTDTRKIKEILKLAEIMLPYWDKEYAARLIAEFSLDTKQRVSKLSKGMLSAVTIILALASKAPMTFLDEPVAGLDVFMREKFYKLLLEEFLATERTFIVSTHIIDEASNVLEDVIIVEDGRIVRNENTEELLSRHRMVSGKDSDIDSFCKNYKVLHTEVLGRAKTVCIEVPNVPAFEKDVAKYDFDVTQASLQKLFTQIL